MLAKTSVEWMYTSIYISTCHRQICFPEMSDGANIFTGYQATWSQI